MIAPWATLKAELARTADVGGRTRFWLRDDDAIAVTPALQRLDGLCSGRMPILLAVIPAGATRDLAAWTAERPSITPCQHGWRHANHATTGERACELGGARSDGDVLAELAQGRIVICDLFGSEAASILVPPWNRIRPSLIKELSGAGYAALSTFGRVGGTGSADLPRLNCDLDIIDWRNGRRGRTVESLCERLVRLVIEARIDDAPIGLLTHHLAHDEAAWRFLGEFLDAIHPDLDTDFIAAPEILHQIQLRGPDDRRAAGTT